MPLIPMVGGPPSRSSGPSPAPNATGSPRKPQSRWSVAGTRAIRMRSGRNPARDNWHLLGSSRSFGKEDANNAANCTRGASASAERRSTGGAYSHGDGTRSRSAPTRRHGVLAGRNPRAAADLGITYGRAPLWTGGPLHHIWTRPAAAESAIMGHRRRCSSQRSHERPLVASSRTDPSMEVHARRSAGARFLYFSIPRSRKHGWAQTRLTTSMGDAR